METAETRNQTDAAPTAKPVAEPKPLPLDMIVYVYLPQATYVNTWVSGGRLPLSLASKYKAVERHGALTPDENLIHHATGNALPVLREFGIDPNRGSEVVNSLFIGSSGLVVVDRVAIRDGLVLCFSKTLSSVVAGRFYRKLCVRLDDVKSLKRILDDQLGSVSQAASCDYVNDYTRDHFVKSERDSWQDEFRLFWPEIQTASTVVLPAGVATQVPLTEEDVNAHIPRQPRNERCGCGSGKQYKHCHGKLD